ncbi:Putative transposase [Heterostelium album PN500]|uniref:Transposase n=1 Tax=Heterostelium pallidum (strain ATCC 26659 / Pp 5 / PN500) TaxID=670386 RepID=D3B830_HETP5|nr:Putative transposase [Heterostelium album PN500]EFA82198.1 Putative transposase [Heterostelium album PN500]|eukprot:XP_020434315.1 Putative transposase [Heterostelium album PN500]
MPNQVLEIYTSDSNNSTSSFSKNSTNNFDSRWQKNSNFTVHRSFQSLVFERSSNLDEGSAQGIGSVVLRHKESWRESNGLIFILDKNFNERLLLVDEKHIKEVITEAHGTEGVGVDISMDFMELPKSVNGYDYVLVVVDRFSKYTTIIPTTKEITALGTAKLIHQHVFSLFGLPLSIVSDRDTRFTSEVWLELFKKVGSKLRMSVPRHPQSDGQSERTNRRIRSMLRKLSLEFKDKWDEEIKNIQFAINSTYNSTIKLSPFEFKLNKDNESLVKGIEPDIIDNEEEFEIEQIIGDRMFRKKKQYQIKWLGYPLDKATWQYSKNIDHAKDLIKEYENNKTQQIQSKKKKI